MTGNVLTDAVGYWLFNQDSRIGDRDSIVDRSGRGNHLAVDGSDFILQTSPGYGISVSGDASYSWLDIAETLPSAEIDLTRDSITVAFSGFLSEDVDPDDSVGQSQVAGALFGTAQSSASDGIGFQQVNEEFEFVVATDTQSNDLRAHRIGTARAFDPFTATIQLTPDTVLFRFNGQTVFVSPLSETSLSGTISDTEFRLTDESIASTHDSTDDIPQPNILFAGAWPRVLSEGELAQVESLGKNFVNK
jgi:hypothetical protein